METTPVGVIVGLFQAISQKLPAFTDWETQKHHHLLNSNPDVCSTMSEVRQHVTQYGMFPWFPWFPGFLFPLILTLFPESYLRGRSNSEFDRGDFDCLSNKFISRLVIRAN